MILGLNGYPRMDIGLMQFYKDMRNTLIKEAGSGIYDSVCYNQAVEFIKKQFKNVSKPLYFL